MQTKVEKDLNGGLNFELATRAPYRHIVWLPLKMLLVLFACNWYNQLRRLNYSMSLCCRLNYIFLMIKLIQFANDCVSYFHNFIIIFFFASLSLEFAFQSHRWHSNDWLKAPLAFIWWKWDVNSNTWMNVNREPGKKIECTPIQKANVKWTVSAFHLHTVELCWSILFGVL